MLLFGSFACAVLLTIGATADDPFITLRYAHNLIGGHGPVLNPGQRVNGATSPAGLLMAAVAVWAPAGHALFKLKLISTVFGLLTVWQGGRVVDTFELPVWCRRSALVLIGSASPIAYASGSGLETTFYSFAVTGLILELKTMRANRDPIRAALFGSAAVLSRPEAPLLLAGMAAISMLGSGAGRRWRKLQWLIGPAIAGGLIISVNRLYYGLWVPNTLYAKELPLHEAIAQGQTYLFRVFDPKSYLASLGQTATTSLAVGGATLLAVGLVACVIDLERYRYLVVPVLCQCLFILASGGDWMLGARFFEPVVIPATILQAVGAVSIVKLGGRLHLRRVCAAGTSCALVVSGIVGYSQVSRRLTIASFFSGVSDYALLAHGQYESLSAIWSALPAFLTCVPPGGLVATTELGYVSFAREDLRFLDMRGLTSRAVVAAEPLSSHSVAGISDTAWTGVGSPLGRLISTTRPSVILTVDRSSQPTVLDGQYRVAASLVSGDEGLQVLQRADVHCPLPASAGPFRRSMGVPSDGQPGTLYLDSGG